MCPITGDSQNLGSPRESGPSVVAGPLAAVNPRCREPVRTGTPGAGSPHEQGDAGAIDPSGVGDSQPQGKGPLVSVCFRAGPSEARDPNDRGCLVAVGPRGRRPPSGSRFWRLEPRERNRKWKWAPGAVGLQKQGSLFLVSIWTGARAPRARGSLVMVSFRDRVPMGKAPSGSGHQQQGTPNGSRLKTVRGSRVRPPRLQGKGTLVAIGP